jgi:putative PIN family toxin of toxin-antitoxin system
MLRAVFDTVVFVRALINPFGIWGRLIFQHGHAYSLIISPPVVEEILEVLHRPELTRRFRSLTGLDLAQVIEILDQAEVVEIQDIPAVSRDPKDDKVLATALAGRADYLVTEDNDLLVLGAHHGIPIVTASQFLASVE